ncbi:MAG: flagellin [bacterium]|nr:flagellin [bacterium]
MSLRINHNVAALNSHRNLLNNDRSLNRTLERLSSGLKVNRGADGPATLVISEQMRAQIAGLTQAIDNSESAISMAQTSEANLGEINRLLTSMRQLAVHAANEGVNDTGMLQADQRELENALASIDRITAQAQFGERKLLDGSNGIQGYTTGDKLQFIESGLNSKDSSEAGYSVVVTQSAERASRTGSQALSADLIAQGEELMLIQGGQSARYVTQSDDSLDQVVAKLQSEVDRNGMQLEIRVSEAGMLSVTHKEYGSAPDFQVFSKTAGVLSAEAGAIETVQNGRDVKGTLNGQSAVGEGLYLTGMEGAKEVDGLKVKIQGQLDQEIPDGGVEVGRVFLSQNALKFQVGGNYGQTVSMNLKDVSTRQLGKGIQNESGFRSLADLDVQSFQGAQDAMQLIDQAITEVSSVRGELGAFQKNTLESNLNNLRVANENLVASESVLRDTDMASEMAQFTRGQIMSESAMAMLAQANQVPENVLTLLS